MFRRAAPRAMRLVAAASLVLAACIVLRAAWAVAAGNDPYRGPQRWIGQIYGTMTTNDPMVTETGSFDSLQKCERWMAAYAARNNAKLVPQYSDVGEARKFEIRNRWRITRHGFCYRIQ